MNRLPHHSRDPTPAPLRDPVASTWEGLARTHRYCRHRLAKSVQVSVRTLDRHFQKCRSVSVQHWVVELQLADAYTQVLTGKPLKEISYDTGFKHPSHFTRLFKARFGIVPSLLKPGLAIFTAADYSPLPAADLNAGSGNDPNATVQNTATTRTLPDLTFET